MLVEWVTEPSLIQLALLTTKLPSLMVTSKVFWSDESSAGAEVMLGLAALKK